MIGGLLQLLLLKTAHGGRSPLSPVLETTPLTEAILPNAAG